MDCFSNNVREPVVQKEKAREYDTEDENNRRQEYFCSQFHNQKVTVMVTSPDSGTVTVSSCSESVSCHATSV